MFTNSTKTDKNSENSENSKNSEDNKNSEENKIRKISFFLPDLASIIISSGVISPALRRGTKGNWAAVG